MKTISSNDIGIILRELRPVIKTKYSFLDDSRIKLIKFSENITCQINDIAGKKYILRINRPLYHSYKELEGEVKWMQELSRDTDLVLPQVFPGNDGQLVQKYYSMRKQLPLTFSLISFLEGKMVGQLCKSKLEDEQKTIGIILAKMHIQSMNRNQEDVIERFNWDEKNLLTDNSRWGDYHTFTGYKPEEMKIIDQAMDIIRSRVMKFGKDRNKYGLIHADMHRSNIIVKDGVSQIFDFDDCGYGWYLYDIGCCLVEYDENVQEYCDGILEGYETVRKMSTEEKNEIPTFVLLRRIVRMAWIASHSDTDTVKGISAKYHETTLKMAEQYIVKNSNCSEPTSKMLCISSGWRIRQK